jgi:hypothetical protein
MIKKLGLLAIVLMLCSCNDNTAKVEVNREAGEWVSGGAKYTIGSDKNVETVKEFIKGYSNLDVERIFNVSNDSIKVYLHNMEEPMQMNRELLTQMFSNYDSIQATPIYFLPYQVNGWDNSVVQVVSKEVRFLKDGGIEKERLLEKFMINKDGKVTAVRQFDAAW